MKRIIVTSIDLYGEQQAYWGLSDGNLFGSLVSG